MNKLKEKLRDKLSMGLTKAEKKALVLEICQICEKQYRKGFQHGFDMCEDGSVNQKQADNFRLKGMIQNYSKVVYPPFFKGKINPIDRISPELAMKNVEVINSLFNGY